MIRKWNFKYTRESQQTLSAHGKFLQNFGWILCRSSICILYISEFANTGKGNLSRADASFSNPNPCFISTGKAWRENKTIHPIFQKGWIFEHSQLNLLEIFFLLKKQKIKFLPNYKLQIIFKIFYARYFSFYWNFIVFNKYKLSGWLLKSGIKYGANFVIYKKCCQFYRHFHSKIIFFLKNPFVYENICHKCLKKNFVDFLNIQLKTRLARHVSKYFIYFYFFSDRHELSSRKWILFESHLNRWSTFTVIK